MAFAEVSTLSLYIKNSIVFSGQEPRLTVHVYGLPSSANMTVESFGLAEDTLGFACVGVCVFMLILLVGTLISLWETGATSPDTDSTVIG